MSQRRPEFIAATRFVTRFAPSPSGYLHRGHAFSALTAFEAAAVAAGDFLLRIEDIDQARCRPEFETAIGEDLAWLGLSWPTPVRRQSEHVVDYQAALASLEARGLLYRCFRTRSEIAADIGRAPHGPEPAWRGGALPERDEARLLSQGRPFAWRLSLAAATRVLDTTSLTFIEEDAAGNDTVHVVRPEIPGDVILARKDLGVAYHLAVVVDDALQGVSHVIRGADLAEACHVQRLLQALLDLPAPRYRHHPLLFRADGKRFAKRDTAETLRDLRARGASPEALKASLGFPTR